jgi:signal transduction histidine kinase
MSDFLNGSAAGQPGKTDEQSPAELSERLERLEEFTATAAHDLREPLRTVAGYLSLLQRREGPTLSSEGQEYLTIALDGTRRMSALLEGLLQFARYGRAGAGRRRPLPEIVAEVLLDLQAAIDGAGAAVEVEELGSLQVEETGGRQLMANLIGNALRYRGDGAARVVVSLEQAELAAVVTVADNGIGVPAELSATIFEPFVRGDRAAGPGAGLGLAICRRIVDGWGGRIWHEPGPGGGSRFRFSVPSRVD